MSKVPAGYKQTEVGVIPEDWEVAGLDRFWSVTDCKHVTAQFVENGFPIASIKEVQSRFVDLTNSKQTTHLFYMLLIEGGRKPKSGDLILSRNATVGEVAQVTEWHPPFAMGQDVCLLRKKTPEFSTNYLQAIFRSHIIANQLADLMVGSTFKRANIEQIRNFIVPMPPAAEQEAIAEALSDTDELIESLEQLIAKKHHLKQGAMQELLTGKKRLPGFSEAWVVKRLGDIGDISGSGVDKKSCPDEIPVRLVNYMDVYRRAFIFSADLEHWVTAPSHQARRCAVQKGDVFFTPSSETRDDIANSTVAMEDIEDAAYSYHVVRLRLREPWDLRFRTYAFKSRAFLSQAETLCDGGGTRYVISQGKFRSLTVNVPSLPEQTAIAAILSDMDAEIAALETKLVKTRQLKQGMMHNLLTGKIRLVSATANITVVPEQRDSVRTPTSSHNWQINEAVIIAVLAKHFGSEQYPLARKRCTKLTYLLHRHVERKAEGYLKKAAGPYNPATRYKGPEGIAQKNGYVRAHHNGTYQGFVAAANIGQAEDYFQQWYGQEALAWLEQFRLKKTDDLELLTTVDMAMEDLHREGKAIQVGTVKQVIHDHPEWIAKLRRELFSDSNIARAMQTCRNLFT